MFSLVKERIGTITVDDIIKEMVLRELPTEIRRTIHDKAKDLDGSATAKLADQYFDKSGKPIHKATSNPVNVITSVPERPQAEEEEDINAVGGRFQRGNRKVRPQQSQPYRPPFKRNQQNNRQPHSFATPPAPSAPPASQKRTNNGRPTVKPANLCYWHLQHGKNAHVCEAGCDKYPGVKAGNSLAGRHT